MQKFKANSQLVPKIEWKQPDGRSDGRTDTRQTEAIALPPSLMRSVKIDLHFADNAAVEIVRN